MTKNQGELKGIESPSIKDIEEASAAYERLRDTRMELLQEEVKSKAALLALMKKHKQKKYRFDGRIVEIVPGEESVKVKKATESKESITD